MVVIDRIDLTKKPKKPKKKVLKKKPVKKKVVKKKPKKKVAKKKILKKKVVKKTSTSNYIDDDSFSPQELKKYIAVMKKMKKNKRTTKQKKVGLTNVVSFLNLLYNADKEKRKKPRKNLMVANAQRYPSLIRDADVDVIWKSTKLPAARTKRGMVSNINGVYRQMLANDLIYGNNITISAPVASSGSKTTPIQID